MTALPDHGTEPHLLTLREFMALPEDNSVRFELQEGVPIVTPRPRPIHQVALHDIIEQLNRQLPRHLYAVAEIDINLDLDDPPTVRIPDVVVIPRADLKKPGLIKAESVLIAVEIISPGSRRTDTVTKASEYSEAQIPHYWVIDLDDRPSLTAHHLAGPFGYQEAPAVVGRFDTTEPMPLVLDLDALHLDN